MGGFGSGPQWGGKRTVERALSLDVRRLQRAGALRRSQTCTWHWTWREYGKEHKASINIVCLGSELLLNYRVTPPGEDLAYTVALDRTPCNFGGERVWLRCPNKTCGRRCRFLYQSGRYYVCRQCAALTYRKQQCHRNPSDEARAAGVSFWDADERWLDWRKDPIRRLRYRIARTRPDSPKRARLLRRLERLYDLKDAERVHAMRVVGMLDKRDSQLMQQIETLTKRAKRAKP